MAFLSLGLNNEQESLAEEGPRASEKKQSNGNGLGQADAAANLALLNPAERTNENPEIPLKHAGNGNNGSASKEIPELLEEKADSWPELGMQIIQSVLREAQSKGVPSPVSEVSALDTPAMPPEISGNGGRALPREIEELRQQISQGITPTFRTEPKEPSDAVSAPPLPFEGSAAIPEPELRPAVTQETGFAGAVPPESLPVVMEHIRKMAEAEKSESSLASTPEGETSSAPTWISKLASGGDDAGSQVTPEMLSPVMEEIRRKLAGDSHSYLTDAFEVAEARARTSASPQSQTDPDLVRTPEAPQSQPRPDSRYDVIPAFATFKFGYLPGRGLLYSIIGHEVAMFAIFLLITYVLPTFREQRLIVGSNAFHDSDHVIFLPEIGGGEQGQKSPGGGVSKPQQASAAPARASKGFAYPGAQAILSDPPNPTNTFQTVLHPLMVHPEPLKKLVPLPNIVQMAEMRLPPALVAPKIALPHFQPPPTPLRVKQDSNLRREANWQAPVKAPQLIAKVEMPKLQAAEQPLPEAPKAQPKPKEQEQSRTQEKPAPEPLKVSAEKRAEKAEKQVAPPSSAQIARLEMHGKAPEPLLSLSPAPLPPGINAKVPAGEARGRFAIAPGGTLNPKSITPGNANGTPSESAATGQEKSQSANAATELASNTGNGAGHNPAAGGGSGNSSHASGGGSAGEGSGSGGTAGTGVGGSGTSNGRGTAGNGAGHSGHGAGTGSGAGSGAGTGAFPGISIQGGEGNQGTSDSHKLKIEPQTPYQITIVATASSGGGLADFGVFENERVYTVYIPMQRTPQEADPTWTLQYALETPSADSGNGQLVAPTPVIREWPQIPPDLEKNYSHRQVVVYGVLGEDGKLNHISVKQTPDVHVSTPVAQALSKWVFHPAQLNNRPVAVKILIGIPL